MLAVPRPPKGGEQQGELAEVIDLVQLPLGSRPTPIAYLDYEEIQRTRVLSCGSYQRCLSFAAQVRWKSFHCRQCPQHPTKVSSDTQLDSSGLLGEG